MVLWLYLSVSHCQLQCHARRGKISRDEEIPHIWTDVKGSSRDRNGAQSRPRPGPMVLGSWIKRRDRIAWPRQLQVNCSESRLAFEFPAKGLWLFLRWGSFVPNWAYNYWQAVLGSRVYINRRVKNAPGIHRRCQLQTCKAVFAFEKMATYTFKPPLPRRRCYRSQDRALRRR